MSESVLGRNCRIGKNAQVRGSYLHDDVIIGDHAHVDCALLCQGAVVHEDAQVQAGAMISFKVRPVPRTGLCTPLLAGPSVWAHAELLMLATIPPDARC